MRPCKYFESGACLKGERCDYAHAVPAAEPQEAAGLAAGAPAAAAGQWAGKIYNCQAQPELTRFPAGFRPRRFCRVLLTGEFCRRGRNCSFAHHAYELHPEVLRSDGAVGEALLAATAREGAGPPAPAQARAPAAPQQEAADPHWTGYRFMKGKRPLTVCQFIYRRQVCPAGESCKLAHTPKEIDARALTEAIVDRFHEVMAEKYHAGMAPLPHGQEPALGASICEIDRRATASRSQAVHNASSSGSSTSSASSTSSSSSSSSSAAHSDQEVPAITVPGARGRKAVRRHAETARSSSQARGSGVAVDCSRRQHGANKRICRGLPREAPLAPGMEASAERKAADAEAGSPPGTPSL